MVQYARFTSEFISSVAELASRRRKVSVVLLSTKLTLIQDRAVKQIICQHKKLVIRSFRSGWTAARRPMTILKLSGSTPRALDESGAAIARQLNWPLTALLLYMVELKQHSHQFSQSPGERV